MRTTMKAESASYQDSRAPVETIHTREAYKQASRHALIPALISASMMTVNMLGSCSMRPVCLRGCTHPHTHLPTLCSLLCTFWFPCPATQQPKESEEPSSSLLDSNSLLTERIHHPNCHKSSCEAVSLFRKRQKIIRRINEDFSLEWLTYVLEIDRFLLENMK